MIPRLPVNRNSVRFRMGHIGHSFRIRFRFRSRRRSTEHNQDFRSEVSTASDQPTGHPTVHAALSAPTGGTAYHRNLAVGRLPLPHAHSILAPVSSRGKVYRETERTSGRGGQVVEEDYTGTWRSIGSELVRLRGGERGGAIRSANKLTTHSKALFLFFFPPSASLSLFSLCPT